MDSKGVKTVIDKNEHDEYKAYGAKTYRIYLQVCHLDNNKSNCLADNLVSMCPPCHIKHDEKHRQLMRLANNKKLEPSKEWIAGSVTGIRLIG